ncbi:MAG: fumarylacetoacetase, partial [Candidatus Eremiobacteraeota bacterium]|nr:fumarylacetoacetase [Candidatus Eremiobacteraeota bacterium]
MPVVRTGETTDPALMSWLPVSPESDFPIQNLPFGCFNSADGLPHVGVAIGDRIVDLHAASETGFFDDCCDRALLQAAVLNPFLAAGPDVWTAVRARLSGLLRVEGDARLREGRVDRFLVKRNDAVLRVPMEIGDYVDFYSSLEHATNLGRLFRPDAEPLLPNWKWLPVGYHARSATIVIDGTPIRRPSGQRKPPAAAAPEFGPSRRLDIELEVGFLVGPGNELGRPIPIGNAGNHIFGFVLVNDWSARDIQAWEYQPLGPFLGKSFATTISPWIVTLAALEPFRVAAKAQDPPPLEYLKTDGASSYSIDLAVDLQTDDMRDRGMPPQRISQTNYADIYWTVAQQLAHATVNGAVTRAGDLYASGT